MSRHQYRHGRTLDAIELRGFTLMQAKNTREGDTIGFLQPTFDYTVEAVESAPLDTIRHRAKDDTMSCCYEPGEWLYVKRATSTVTGDSATVLPTCDK